MTNQAFSSLQLKQPLLDNLSSLKYEAMTPIQAQSLPEILAGKDVIGQGKTGSGKTASFGLGILNKIDAKRFHIQSLILCPTRELADQVANEIRKLARTIPNVKVLTICGGKPFGAQAGSLEHGAHIVVGTPGRIQDHLDRETIHFKGLETLVLDEADRMLDMGFQDAIDSIIQQTPRTRQTLLFSATFPEKIESIAKRILKNPEKFVVAPTHGSGSIQQHFYKVDDNDRIQALRLLLLQYQADSTVIFCNLKAETKKIAEALNSYGFSAIELNGDLEQRERDQTLIRFANKSISILVATDVASRGLDIDALDLVVNYQMVRDPETYVHRIGRTGRAGSSGIACTLFDDNDDYFIALLRDYLEIDLSATGEPLPPNKVLERRVAKAKNGTIQIDGGKKQKLRPGDIVGALTAGKGISGDQIGKIHVADNWSYVAVNSKVLNLSLERLNKGKLKGRSFRARLVS